VEIKSGKPIAVLDCHEVANRLEGQKKSALLVEYNSCLAESGRSGGQVRYCALLNTFGAKVIFLLG
jgi:hypothetical protein